MRSNPATDALSNSRAELFCFIRRSISPATSHVLDSSNGCGSPRSISCERSSHIAAAGRSPRAASIDPRHLAAVPMASGLPRSSPCSSRRSVSSVARSSSPSATRASTASGTNGNAPGSRSPISCVSSDRVPSQRCAATASSREISTNPSADRHRISFQRSAVRSQTANPSLACREASSRSPNEQATPPGWAGSLRAHRGSPRPRCHPPPRGAGALDQIGRLGVPRPRGARGSRNRPSRDLALGTGPTPTGAPHVPHRVRSTRSTAGRGMSSATRIGEGERSLQRDRSLEQISALVSKEISREHLDRECMPEWVRVVLQRLSDGDRGFRLISTRSRVRPCPDPPRQGPKGSGTASSLHPPPREPDGGAPRHA